MFPATAGCTGTDQCWERDRWKGGNVREGNGRVVPLEPQGRIPQEGCAAQRSPEGKFVIFLLLSLSHNVCAVPHFKYRKSYFLNHRVS